MLDDSSNPILIDFDSSKREGTLFVAADKRGASGWRLESAVLTEKENDWFGLECLEKYLTRKWTPEHPVFEIAPRKQAPSEELPEESQG